MNEMIARLATALTNRYRVERELGQGGMATVYLATDLRHDRQVAIKVLHEDLGATLGPERFLAEIKTTAKLQHPHILTLLDSGSTAEGQPGGLLYYVMPYVDGESLRDRLDREKQLPIDDAVRIAREIADALGAAHALGIVHRDIKPENILLQSGHALVADFGIALAVQQSGGARMTQTGLSLGTPQYMAPEQAMGEKAVDARADIYALGAVTYEMLVGEPPFTGATVQAIVAKVLSSEPEPPTTMRKTIPAHIEDAVLTALAKLPADRFASASAFASALGGGGSTVNSGARAQSARPGRRSIAEQGRAWAIAGVTLGLFAGVALGYVAWSRDAVGGNGATAVRRAYLLQPPSEVLKEGTTDFALAPDGESFVYVGPGEQAGTTQLWRKRRSELHASRIPGTAGANAPFFSPDGGSIAYYTPAGLVKLSLAGGAPVTIGAGLFGGEGHGTWLDDGTIVAPNLLDLAMVRSEGGTVQLLAPNAAFAGYNPIYVEPLPDSRGVVVQTCPSACPRASIYAVDIKTKAVKFIVEGRHPVYLPSGHLAYVGVTGALLLAPFDPKTLSITGEAVPVSERVSQLSVSRNGTLLYRESEPGEAYRAVWVDRAGHATVIDTTWLAHISSFSISPDRRRVAVSVVVDGAQHVYLKDLPNGPLSKFTGGPLNHFRPVWSSDGKTLWFVRGDKTFDIVEKNIDGSGDIRPVRVLGHQAVEVATSSDGAWLVLRTGGADTTRSVFIQRRGTDSLPRRVALSPGNRLGLTVSPDSRFIAFQSPVSGKPEVYVTPFPDMGKAQWQISLSGGVEPRWSADGKDLYYVTLKDELMVAHLALGAAVSVQSTAKIMDVVQYQRDAGFHVYEPDLNGQRFLMIRRETYPGELVIVDNWFSELKDKLKAKR